MIDKDILYCSNVGDSRCFYIDDKKAIQMTEDHNCKNELEVDAIKKRGGMVFSGKVYGALSLTRPLGILIIKNMELFVSHILIEFP